ncbi:hypothetical protein [Methylophilus aquaticus]|uniref:Signal peptide prediction n=1 Tax=Methylophilus aquaticus TaxID=1971610 RepID=A0ABT9JWP0_9PROT|nr:hypothetical protein [Methylophilus aquaticus]MDP8568465.1 hypothetical protein [Methylophilus aquaticus]
MMMQFKKILAYLWASPTTLVGVALAMPLLLTGAKIRCVQGAFEIYDGWLLRCLTQAGGFAAMTLGHIVIGVSADCLHTLRCHEHVHVRQAERWGILFIPAYVLAGCWQSLCGRHAYYDNPFEREAFAADEEMQSHDG